MIRSFSRLFGAAIAVAALARPAAARGAQAPLAGSDIPQFAQPLPTLSVSGGTLVTVFGNTPLTIRMCEFDAKVLPPGTFAPGAQPLTRVWGYVAGPCPTTPRDTYIGPVIVNTRGTPTPITFVNDLGTTATTGVLAYKYSTDQTLHWADPLHVEANECEMTGGIPPPGSPCAMNYAGPIPAVPHLHGGEVPPAIDGGPTSWFTSDGLFHGTGYYSFSGALANEAIYRYPNTQEAAPLWFHDHTLGATRLNVFAGLAGGYVLVDPDLSLPANLPGPADIIPIVLQDRMFDTNGQLLFPAGAAGDAPNPEHPYWVPEFVGDTIVVNGKAWPYLDVQPRRYRFLFLNGSNARTYELSLVKGATDASGPPIYVIGTDGGYLDAPVRIDPAAGGKLRMMPGERYEVIIDFAGFAGSKLVLRNIGRTPYPKGSPPQGSTLGRILQFRVASGSAADASYDPASGTPLRSGSQKIVRLADPAAGTVRPGVTIDKTRQLTLNEIIGPKSEETDPETGELIEFSGGPLEVLVNNTKWSGESARAYDDFTAVTVGGRTTLYSELPVEGATELWEIVNLTADAHPIHLHLVQFQIVNRQGFNTNRYDGAYAAAFPGGEVEPGFGPPLDYRADLNPLSGGKDGGNPNVDPYTQGPIQPPLPYEAGWKDTVVVPPGAITRVIVRWAPTDLPVSAPSSALFYPFDPADDLQHGYVWHCHIIDHEDNEMMRPDAVQLNPGAPAPALRPLRKGIAY